MKVADSKIGKLPSLDAARFIAALLVTMFHATFTVVKFQHNVPFGGAFRGGHAGVEYFFVLSGFIIYYAHARDLSDPSSIGTYVRKRATRILPMLWLTLLGWSLLRAVLAGETTNAATPVSTLILDMLLLPHRGPLVLGVTWTLQRELIFYALFAIALWKKRLGLAVLLTWQISIIFVSLAFADINPWLAAIFDIHNMGFGLGLLISVYHSRLQQWKNTTFLLIGSGMFVGLLALEWFIGGPLDAEFRPLGQWGSPVLYTIAAGFFLMGLLIWDQRTNGRENAILALLGGSSYVLYLIHGPVGSLVIRLATHVRLPPEIAFVLLTLIPVAVAVMLHIWVEKPILRALRPRRNRTMRVAVTPSV